MATSVHVSQVLLQQLLLLLQLLKHFDTKFRHHCSSFRVQSLLLSHCARQSGTATTSTTTVIAVTEAF
jgi:hypothetical protein